MAVSSLKAQIFGGEAAGISQRVEDNAFHLQQTPTLPIRDIRVIRGFLKCISVDSCVFVVRIKIVSARAPQPAREGACAPQSVTSV
jgi:hypothetical protein